MKRPLNPASIRAPFAQYSHAVEVPAGRMVFASGQLGVSPDDQVPEDAEAQAVLCFENIKAILAEAGMTLRRRGAVHGLRHRPRLFPGLWRGAQPLRVRAMPSPPRW